MHQKLFFTFLRKTKRGMETMSSNCLKLESIFVRKFCFNMAVESTRFKYF